MRSYEAHGLGEAPRDRLLHGLALSAAGPDAGTVDANEMHDDLVQDMIDVLTSFCARLYGRRSAKRHAQRAVAAMDPT